MFQESHAMGIRGQYVAEAEGWSPCAVALPSAGEPLYLFARYDCVAIRAANGCRSIGARVAEAQGACVMPCVPSRSAIR
jgi:hypothetical protein